MPMVVSAPSSGRSCRSSCAGTLTRWRADFRSIDMMYVIQRQSHKEKTMVSPFTPALPTGRASFESTIRCLDELPQDVFSVELVGQPTLYGIWSPKWAPNGND